LWLRPRPVDAPPIPEAQAAQAAAADAVGSRPAGLVAARGGKADNLKRIKGIGPQNEARLNALGTWHFDQIAAWSPTNAKWVGAFLAFPGRIEREDWITQAKALAAGEETAFSKRVDTGSVAYQAIDRAAEAKIVADIAEDGVPGDKPKDLP
jgi:predicted flap endonuclease-1-like 5' DNA nuclease